MQKIHARARQAAADCQQKAVDLLKDNGVSLEKISEYLLEKENITGEEFMTLLREDVYAAGGAA